MAMPMAETVNIPLLPQGLSLADFLGSMITFTIAQPEGFAYYRTSTLNPDLPGSINVFVL